MGLAIKYRKSSPVLDGFIEEAKKNPIVEQLENDPIPGLTTHDDIRELQDRLVQTCIDFINEKGLTDIYDVSFNADSLAESAEYGSWQPCTDSYIKVEGLGHENHRRQDGSIFRMPYRYEIGESL
jgi:hypothetical protein